MSDELDDILPKSVGDDDTEDEEVTDDEEEEVQEPVATQTTNKRVKLPSRKKPEVKGPKPLKKGEYIVKQPVKSVVLSGRSMDLSGSLDYNNARIIEEKPPQKVVKRKESFFENKTMKTVGIVVITVLVLIFMLWLAIYVYRKYYFMNHNPMNEMLINDKDEIERKYAEEMRQNESNKRNADVIFEQKKETGLSGGRKKCNAKMKRDARGRFIKSR